MTDDDSTARLAAIRDKVTRFHATLGRFDVEEMALVLAEVDRLNDKYQRLRKHTSVVHECYRDKHLEAVEYRNALAAAEAREAALREGVAKAADEVARIVFAFDRGDSRQADIRALVARMRALLDAPPKDGEM